MKKLTERELERLLTASVDGEPSPEPPADLADRIKADIPAELPVPDLDFGTPERSGWSVHRWRLAAVLTMIVGGGSLAWWVAQDPPSLTDQAPAAQVSEPQVPEPEVAAPAGAESSDGVVPDFEQLRARARGRELGAMYDRAEPEDSEAAVLRELREDAADLRKRPIPDPAPDLKQQQDEVRRRLRSLGYMAGDDQGAGATRERPSAVSGGRQGAAERDRDGELVLTETKSVTGVRPSGRSGESRRPSPSTCRVGSDSSSSLSAPSAAAGLDARAIDAGRRVDPGEPPAFGRNRGGACVGGGHV